MAMQIYTTYRFGFYIPSKDCFIGATAIHTDPFSGDLWVVRAHIKGEPSLVEHLSEVSLAQVFLFERGTEGDARRIGVKWTGCRWSPIDLDATKSEYASERLVLTGVTYGPVEDIKREDVPQTFKVSP